MRSSAWSLSLLCLFSATAPTNAAPFSRVFARDNDCQRSTDDAFLRGFHASQYFRGLDGVTGRGDGDMTDDKEILRLHLDLCLRLLGSSLTDLHLAGCPDPNPVDDGLVGSVGDRQPSGDRTANRNSENQEENKPPAEDCAPSEGDGDRQNEAPPPEEPIVDDRTAPAMADQQTPDFSDASATSTTPSEEDCGEDAAEESEQRNYQDDNSPSDQTADENPFYDDGTDALDDTNQDRPTNDQDQSSTGVPETGFRSGSGTPAEEECDDVSRSTSRSADRQQGGIDILSNNNISPKVVHGGKTYSLLGDAANERGSQRGADGDDIDILSHNNVSPVIDLGL